LALRNSTYPGGAGPAAGVAMVSLGTVTSICEQTI
jgi:hypothetical protein